jgi:hypothetical protein
MVMAFEVLGPIERVERIATGRSLRAEDRLNRMHGKGRWRKLKGIARIRFPDGYLCRAEVHWCEAHGIGRVEMKLVRKL